MDKEQLDNLKAGEQALTFVSDANISWIMNKSTIYERNFLARWDYALDESGRQRMDFNYNYTLPVRGLVPGEDGDVMQFDQKGGFMMFDGAYTAYNLNDAGQFLWGHSMKKLGFDYTSAVFGAHSHAVMSSFSLDTKADQKAIRKVFIIR